jgi:hypothetical protein
VFLVVIVMVLMVLTRNQHQRNTLPVETPAAAPMQT